MEGVECMYTSLARQSVVMSAENYFFNLIETAVNFYQSRIISTYICRYLS